MGQDWLSCGDTAFPSQAFRFIEGKAWMGVGGLRGGCPCVTKVLPSLDSNVWTGDSSRLMRCELHCSLGALIEKAHGRSGTFSG